MEVPVSIQMSTKTVGMHIIDNLLRETFSFFKFTM